MINNKKILLQIKKLLLKIDDVRNEKFNEIDTRNMESR